MFFTFINDFVSYLENNLSASLRNLIYFAVGLGIGILLFLILFLVLFIIIKTKKKVTKNTLEPNIKEEYKSIIENNKKQYSESYQNASFKEIFQGFGKTLYKMLEEISMLYNPESHDPIFEVSFDRLVDFLDYAIDRVEYTIKTLTELTLVSTVEKITKKSIRNEKLSQVFVLLDKYGNKKKEEPEEQKPKKGFFKKTFGKILNSKPINAIKEKAVRKSENYVTGILENLIGELGEDINKLYSSQELEFTLKTKKELKLLKKEAK